MKTLRSIRRRIRSVQNIHDITNAMEMVYSVRFARVERRYYKSLPYAENLEWLIARLLSEEAVVDNPFFDERRNERELLIVISSDRGLCGSFNANLFTKLEDYIKESSNREISILSIGKKAAGFIRRQGWMIFDELTDIGYNFNPESLRGLIDKTIKVYLSGEYDSVNVLSARIERHGIFRPVVEPLLSLRYLIDRKKGTMGGHDYIFEPDAKSVLQSLCEAFVRQDFFIRLLRSVTAEYYARTMAMKFASDNSNDLMGELTLERNKLRQASITSEIGDIMGGVEALA